MQLEFTKMQGLGNDFVVIDGINQCAALSREQLRFLADRHFGIGCDQILIVEPPTSAEVDFRYRIFNADGGEVDQCGNGARCFAKFVRDRNLTAKTELMVETRAGRLHLVAENENSIRVNMGIPRHEPAAIPLRVATAGKLYTVRSDDREISFSAVSLGNPHAVLQVEDVELAPVQQLGPWLQAQPLFPEGVNVGFMQIIDRHHVKLRVFERGSGETLACGSGACAAAVVGIEWEKLASPVSVTLRGGVLNIAWEGRKHPIYMSGPAASVFEGTIRL
ncbi:MAG: diaminopimelate epimerase [Gammaproteobacteria bacterium]